MAKHVDIAAAAEQVELTQEEKLHYILSIINGCKPSLEQNIVNEDIVVFLGNTKGGKSTVVNLVIGNKLIGAEDEDTFKTIIEKYPGITGPEIGTGATSQTTVPSKWQSLQIPQKIWDLPGFEDNRGVVQDIPNAFFIREILRYANSVKFVLVSDVQDIYGDSIKPFINLLQCTHTLLPDITKIMDGISIIFTKVPARLNREKICQLLDIKIINSKDIDIPAEERQLVEHFINNSKFIGIFKEVEEGDIDLEKVDDGIFDSISNSIPVERYLLENINLGISLESEAFLLQSHNEFCQMPEFDSFLQKIVATYIQCVNDIERVLLSNNFVPEEFIAKESELANIRKIITGIEQQDSVNSPFVILCSLGAIDAKIIQEVETSNIQVKEKFINFIEQIIPKLNHSGIFINQALKTVARINTTLNKFEISFKYHTGKIAEQEYVEQQQKLEAQQRQIEQDFDKTTQVLIAANNDVVEHAKIPLSAKMAAGAGGISAIPVLAFAGMAALPIVGIVMAVTMAACEMGENMIDEYNSREQSKKDKSKLPKPVIFKTGNEDSNAKAKFTSSSTDKECAMAECKVENPSNLALQYDSEHDSIVSAVSVAARDNETEVTAISCIESGDLDKTQEQGEVVPRGNTEVKEEANPRQDEAGIEIADQLANIPVRANNMLKFGLAATVGGAAAVVAGATAPFSLGAAGISVLIAAITNCSNPQIESEEEWQQVEHVEGNEEGLVSIKDPAETEIMGSDSVFSDAG